MNQLITISDDSFPISYRFGDPRVDFMQLADGFADDCKIPVDCVMKFAIVNEIVPAFVREIAVDPAGGVKDVLE